LEGAGDAALEGHWEFVAGLRLSGHVVDDDADGMG